MTMDMRDEVLSSVGAQDMETSGYQVSDLDVIEFHWEDLDFNMDKFFRPGIDTPFFSSTFNISELCSMAENPILIDDEEDKENTPPLRTIPVSERPTQPPVLMKSFLLEEELRILPISPAKTSSNDLYCFCVCTLLETIIILFQFIISFFKNWSNMCDTKALLGSLLKNLADSSKFLHISSPNREKIGTPY